MRRNWLYADRLYSVLPSDVCFMLPNTNSRYHELWRFSIFSQTSLRAEMVQCFAVHQRQHAVSILLFMYLKKTADKKQKKSLVERGFLVILNILKKRDVLCSSGNPKLGEKIGYAFFCILHHGFRMSFKTLQFVFDELHYLKAF